MDDDEDDDEDDEDDDDVDDDADDADVGGGSDSCAAGISESAPLVDVVVSFTSIPPGVFP